jgi:O-antigen/teichoic acid export membrane protein
MSSVHAALKWSFLGEIASKAVTPVVFVVLARLLTPEDFGVVAAATMVISFSQIFWEAGMGRAIIQYRGDRTVAANAAFWVNNALGLLVAGVLVTSSGLIADRIFHDPRVAPVLQVMALQVLLSASVSIHIALLQKDLNFRHLFWVRLATVAIPGLASIPLALYGMGYWALVAGVLAGQVFQVALLWRTSPWCPRFTFDRRVARELVGFGGWVAVTALFAWFYLWADSLIVGIYLGPRELGLYRTGNAFVVMIYGLIFSPLMPVLYSHLSAISHDRDRIREIMTNVIRMLTFLSLPLAAIIAANADLIGGLVFGPKWAGISLVIAVMALTQGVSWIISANGEAYRAIGKPSIETKAMGLSLGIYLIGYLVSIQHGFEAFVWTRLGLVFVGAFIQLKLIKQFIGIDIKKVIGYSFVMALVCSIPILIAMLVMRERYLVTQIGLFGFTSISIACLLFLYERNRLIPQLWHISKKMLLKP